VAAQLFTGQSIVDVSRQRIETAARIASGAEAQHIEPGKYHDYVALLTEQYRLQTPVLLVDQIYSPMGFEDVQLVEPIQGRLGRTFTRGKRLVEHIPFEGDADCFKYRPPVFTVGGIPTSAVVVGQELILTWEGPSNYDPATVNAFRESNLGSVQRDLDRLAPHIDSFNEDLAKAVPEAVGRRLAELRRDREAEEELGIQVRSRPDPAPVLTITVEDRRSIDLTPPPSAGPSSSIEPGISESDYEKVLETLRSFGYAAVRFPNTFGKMREDVLREILLVILNNQFGPAGGELFSREGKTDIAILGDGFPVFIAECKIWRGKNKFDEAIDQLFSYMTWRDNKAAIVLFIRNLDVTTALSDAANRLTAHPRCKRELAPTGSLRTWLFHQEGDTAKEIKVALVDIPVPRPRPPSRSTEAGAEHTESSPVTRARP